MSSPSLPATSPTHWTAHWDPTFDGLHPTQWQKAARIAWNIFSVIVFPIGLVRLALYGLKVLVSKGSFLPAQNSTPYNYFPTLVEKYIVPNNAAITQHTVTTPDGVQLAVYRFTYKQALHMDPTILYFNPNGAVSSACPFENLFPSLIAQDVPFHFVVFDYRNTGASQKAPPPDLNDLVVDGLSVVKWLKDEIKTPEDRLRLHGYSLGGAVATLVMQAAGLPGPLCNERSFSSSDAMIQSLLPRTFERIASHSEQIPFCLLKAFARTVLPSKRIQNIAIGVLQLFSRIVGYSINVVPAFNRLKGPTLVVYHPKDQMMQGADLAGYVKPPQGTSLELYPQQPFPDQNPHCSPLSYHTNGPSPCAPRAPDLIAQFLLPLPTQE